MTQSDANPKIGDLVRAINNAAARTPIDAADFLKARDAILKAHNNKTIGLVCDKRDFSKRLLVLVKWFDASNSKPYWYWVKTWAGRPFEVFNEF